MQQLYQEEIVKIQPKGLVTIPKKFRNELGFAENSLVRIKEEKGRLVMEVVRTLSYPVRSYTDSEIDQFFELDEKESKDLKKKGLL
ncbi:hypothetical protein A3B45_02795 [Candidatus Daviesbacteria bacterium RIFCSPLOWO2_01_FULL_39_12]|uniref:SpoVT-AbrB domain-containing protein n=1 Tax=Candidatus Daviesbacteria bacterium RIFCSPLOWO2_01_FULL_39_12 TaxID=1797785 RepID=A0A1F5KSN1_9BACT|nr:MAG: hypothetical protein A3D79_02425 [Candidatus Daviesbacteria bacterium RIFCSPHIGHO2_02_FULL_39_8]OGE43933.1 MAG: hypothetical protein A3B45_02795 [Candidatus Daviesbacteria bacterium RIFCSPLOWO2_01_FULL_39_12]